MDTSFHSFFLVLLISSSNISLSSSQSFLNFTTDEYTLITLKNSITNSILLKNWSIRTPICNWIGVSCGTKHLRVTALNLSGFELRGPIAPHLGNLTFLRSLDISSNYFTGALPSELSKLRRLGYINVGANNFTGEIPSWFGALSKLRVMYLNNNNFNGGIPSSLFNISRLRTLDMSFNSIEENIPEEIGNLGFLETINLRGNKLNGSIPKALFNISSLVGINLGSNSLSGKIPHNMNTPKLKMLHLFENQLFGEIPLGIYSCGELEELGLAFNRFSGNIPIQIGNLTILHFFSLKGNEFKGSIPKELGNLTSLIALGLNGNRLTGEIAEEVCKLGFLRVLFVGNNSLSGAIPHGVFNISTLQQLDLSFNHFSGTLPSSMGVSLFKLGLQFNRLSGPIPSSINNASQLHYLSLQFNSFSGTIPSFASLRLLEHFSIAVNHLSGAAKSPTQEQELEFLSSLTHSQNLRLIEVSENPLNGALPTSLGNLSQSLEVLSAFGARIRGAIPSEIGNLTNLRDLNLYDNQLSGSIPSTIGNLKKLGRLSLSYNQLQGSIPTHLCQMSSLLELYLSNNELGGPLPECMGEIQSLIKIFLSSNKLNSTMPSSLWNITDLIFLDLSSNYLSGRLSSRIGKLKAINLIYLSSNLFSGDIPTSIAGCESLEYLYLSENKFGGSIPRSLGNVRGLSELNLSHNYLSGFIPESLQGLKVLEYFNVSYNRLEGAIPNGGVFANFTAQSFVNNSGLCGAARFEVPPCLDDDGGPRSRNVDRLMKYILPPLISAIFVVTIAVLLVRRWRRVTAPTAVDSSLGVSWRVISYIELSRATYSFSEANLLGRGSFGSVFKGTLSEGLSIAVKVFNLELEEANKSFGTESRILSTIRHRNLLRVIGCCTNLEFKALILEFMPNGSLEKWLYSDGNNSIDILQLLNIVIDVALALEYLHHGNIFPVVHCDIKPSNVLLDEDMTARVADFGISKLFEEGEAMIQTKTLATIGYAAPEYGSEGKVSTSADVYSFGILLLEMLTRKKPTDDMFNEEMSLKEWVSEALEANAMNQVLAPALLSEEEDEHFVVEEESVACVFDLAMKCLAVSPEERMNMIEAVSTLKKIKAIVATAVTTTRPQQHAVTIIT